MYAIKDKVLQSLLESPVVMGILNATPDSFYASSRVVNDASVIEKAAQMIEEGAAIIDIGGQSTRPDSIVITQQEELDRVIPIIQQIKSAFPEIIISVDTFSAKVAKEAVQAGAALVNDISFGTLDPLMLSTVAHLNIPYIGMHIKGTQETMHATTHYDDLVIDIKNHLAERLEACNNAGIQDVIIDPGFGFSKTLDQNYTLLKEMHQFQVFEKPLLVGLSRKSMIYKLLGSSPNEAINGTTALHMFALQQGARILRVHDVKEAKECILLYLKYINA